MSGTGGILGYLSGRVKKIVGCYCKGEIINHNAAGNAGTAGILGFGIANIENSYNEANINGVWEIGGISGHGNSTIFNCYNTGNINASNGHIGGITGYNFKKIENCYNIGNLTATGDNVGGISGNAYCVVDGSISKCYNTGKVTGKSAVGGILGNSTAVNNFLIEQSYNLGEITATDGRASGIAGHTNVVITVANCYNMNKIKATQQVSGITYDWNRDDTMKVISCYNIGILEGATKYAFSNSGIVKNSYYQNTCGATDLPTLSKSDSELKGLANELDKAYTINAETGEVTISETEIQNVWTDDTQNKNEGYPIFK